MPQVKNEDNYNTLALPEDPEIKKKFSGNLRIRLKKGSIDRYNSLQSLQPPEEEKLIKSRKF